MAKKPLVGPRAHGRDKTVPNKTPKTEAEVAAKHGKTVSNAGVVGGKDVKNPGAVSKGAKKIGKAIGKGLDRLGKLTDPTKDSKSTEGKDQILKTKEQAQQERAAKRGVGGTGSAPPSRHGLGGEPSDSGVAAGYFKGRNNNFSHGQGPGSGR